MVRGMNSAEMQKNNRTLVFKLLQERGMITRAEIAVELNLQKATITNIINEFFDIAKLSQAYQTLHKEEINLYYLLEDVERN